MNLCTKCNKEREREAEEKTNRVVIDNIISLNLTLNVRVRVIEFKWLS